MIKEQEKGYFSVAEVAKIMHISRVAVFKQIQSGRLPAEKVGRNYIIERNVLQAALGSTVTSEQKKEIQKVVKKAVKQYGVAFRRLGREE